MSSITMTSARMIRRMALAAVSSAPWRRTSAPRCSRLNQDTLWPASTAAWPSASRKWVLPVPDGPHTTRFSWRWIHSRVRSARWVGAGIELTVSSQASKVLPVGNPAALRRAGWRTLDGRRALRPAARASLRPVPSVVPGGQQVRRGDTHVGQAQGAQQVDDLVDQGLVHRSPPRRPQAAVEGCSECASSARRRCPGGSAARIEARSPSAKRPNIAAWPSAQSSRSVLCSRARVTASAILTFMRLVPAAAASTSQVRAPSPMARNSASATLVGFGRRRQRPRGAWRVVGVVDHRMPRRRTLVAGDLDWA